MLLFVIAVALHISLSCFGAEPTPFQCRTERRVYLPFERFKSDVCARCYYYMPASSFKVKFRYDRQSGVLLHPRANTSYEADPFGRDETLLDSFVNEDLAAKWRGCCSAAWECCHKMARDPQLTEDAAHCPRTWDGWHCWPDTPAGTTARQPCQYYIYFESRPPSCTRYAHKECLPNGTWYLSDSREWTNYTKCGRRDDHRRHLSFHIATYTVSIVALIPALIIFMAYKQLQVHRIALHRNLFVSLLLNGAMVLLFKGVVMAGELDRLRSRDSSVIEQNGSFCKLLIVLTNYFRMTTYMWMFCEGYYLHKLIAAAFAEQKNLIMFYAIGWGLPVLPVSIYAILRAMLENEKCWAHPVERFEWVMNVPNLLILLVNLLFLCNIIRVLVTKLRATHANEPSQYRKAVRATLVLVPLFGLHVCIAMYRPQSGGCSLTEAYVYLNFALDGLQGFMVALIFCYLNGEVLYLLKRSYQRYKLHFQMRGFMRISATSRRMSATQDSTMNDSHHSHSHRNRPKELNHSHNGRQNKGHFSV